MTSWRKYGFFEDELQSHESLCHCLTVSRNSRVLITAAKHLPLTAGELELYSVWGIYYIATFACILYSLAVGNVSCFSHCLKVREEHECFWWEDEAIICRIATQPLPFKLVSFHESVANHQFCRHNCGFWRLGESCIHLWLAFEHYYHAITKHTLQYIPHNPIEHKTRGFAHDVTLVGPHIGNEQLEALPFSHWTWNMVVLCMILQRTTPLVNVFVNDGKMVGECQFGRVSGRVSR